MMLQYSGWDKDSVNLELTKGISLFFVHEIHEKPLPPNLPTYWNLRLSEHSKLICCHKPLTSGLTELTP